MNSKIKIGGLAVISAALAGVLAFGSGVNAQTPSPTATPNSKHLAQGQQRPGGRGGPGGMMIGNRPNSPHAIAAKALGITEDALRTELQAGKTIADVATSKGVALTTISNAILDARKADLAKAVTDGKLTQAQADQILADAPTRINDLLNGKGFQGGPGELSGPRGGHFGDPVNAPHVIAAKLLGLDKAALRTELQAGKTIADLATSKGVALTTISSAILDAQKVDLAKAVTNGKLTQAQADQMLTDAPTRINDMLTGKAPAGRPQGGPGGHGKQAGKGPAMGRQAGEQGQQHGGPRGGAQIGNPANAPHAIAAKLLGLDEAALRTELQAGKTISDVAASKGVALDTIATAILDAQKADVAKAVTDGKLTQAQANKILADAPARINTMLTKAHAQRGPGGPRGNDTQIPKPTRTPAPRTGGSNG